MSAETLLVKGSTLYTIKTLLSVLYYLRNPKGSFLKVLLNSSNFQFATSLAGLSAVYRYLKAKLKGFLDDRYVPLVAGSFSSLLLMLDRDSGRTRMLSQLVVIRTFYYLLRAYVYKSNPALKSEPRHTAQLQVRESTNAVERFIRNTIHSLGHYIVWVYCSFKVCYTSFVEPEFMTKSFYRTLLWTTNSRRSFGKNAETYVRGLANLNRALVALPDVSKIEHVPSSVSSVMHYRNIKENASGALKDSLVQIQDIESFLDSSAHHDWFCCSAQHPKHTRCIEGAMDRFGAIFKLTYKTYFILNALPVVYHFFSKYVLKRGSKTKENENDGSKITQAVISSLRTCTMTSAYVACFEIILCSLRRIFGRETSIA
jgi:hypothetical protein